MGRRAKMPPMRATFLISLESNSYGLYTKLERAVKDDRSKRAFGLLTEEERRHLNRMTSLIREKPRHVSLDNVTGIG